LAVVDTLRPRSGMNRSNGSALARSFVSVEGLMGNVAAILGVVLLIAGVVLVALFGDARSASWGPALGIALVVLGLGVELVGAVAVAA